MKTEEKDPMRYSQKEHEKLLTPLLEILEKIPTVLRDKSGKISQDQWTIADYAGSYPLTVIRFKEGISLKLELQDDGGEPYMIGELSKFAPKTNDYASERLVLGYLAPHQLEQLPELVEKLSKVTVPTLLGPSKSPKLESPEVAL